MLCAVLCCGQAVVVVTSEVLLKGPMGVATTAMTSADGLVMIAVELHQAAADKDKDAHLALQLEGTPTTRLATTVAAWTSDVVVEKASTWKYLYDGKFPVDWRLTLPGFNDATWKSGASSCAVVSCSLCSGDFERAQYSSTSCVPIIVRRPVFLVQARRSWATARLTKRRRLFASRRLPSLRSESPSRRRRQTLPSARC
jgi:hypothetical protein